MVSPRFLTGLAVLSVASVAFAQTTSPYPSLASPQQMVEVRVNGVPITNGIEKDGTIQVSPKAFASAIGARVEAGPDGRSVTVLKDARTYVASSTESVPLRTMAMAFGGTLTFDRERRTANVAMPQESRTETPSMSGMEMYSPDTQGASMYAPDAATSLYAPDAAATYAPDTQATAMYAPDTYGGSRPQTFSGDSATPADPGFMAYVPWIIVAFLLIAIAAFFAMRRPSGNVIAADRDRNP